MILVELVRLERNFQIKQVNILFDMARPKKNNAEYFSHDANMRNDRKIKAVRSKYGLEGYAIWCMVLEALTDAQNFTLPYDEIEMEVMAGDFGISSDLLGEMMDYFQRLKLITRTETNIFSENLLSRMQPLIDKRQRERAYAETKKSTPKKSNRAKNNTKKEFSTPKTKLPTPKTPQSKVKESKVKESKGGGKESTMPPPNFDFGFNQGKKEPTAVTDSSPNTETHGKRVSLWLADNVLNKRSRKDDRFSSINGMIRELEDSGRKPLAILSDYGEFWDEQGMQFHSTDPNQNGLKNNFIGWLKVALSEVDKAKQKDENLKPVKRSFRQAAKHFEVWERHTSIIHKDSPELIRCIREGHSIEDTEIMAEFICTGYWDGKYKYMKNAFGKKYDEILNQSKKWIKHGKPNNDDFWLVMNGKSHMLKTA